MTAQILKPFGIAPPTGEPNTKLVDGIKELLRQAEHGEIDGMFAVTSTPDAATVSVMLSGDSGAMRLLGGLRLLERDVMQKYWPL